MVKRALFFSTPYSLSLRDNQMIIRTKEAPDMQRTVPVEDIGVVVLEDRQTSVTLPLLNALSDNNAAVIFCGDDRMPNAMLMNLDSNRTQGENYRTQIEASEPLKKGIWRQIVEAKIRNQAALLQKFGQRRGAVEALLPECPQRRCGQPGGDCRQNLLGRAVRPGFRSYAGGRCSQ